MKHSVRIPGKVMLSGEYAVLHSGGSVLLPVDRFLEVSEGEAGELPPAAAEAIVQSMGEEEKPLSGVVLDRSEFTATTTDGDLRKLGIGSSAAEAVGVIALRMQRQGIDWRRERDRVARLADEAHRRAQGGRGSGADVYASAYAAPIRYRLGFNGGEAEEIQPASDVELPKLTLAWTAEPANTRTLVDTFEEWLANDPLADGTLARLVDAADELSGYWLRATLDDLLPPFDEFVARMSEISTAAKLPWRLGIHEELDEWARDHGGRAKPTGAGGGDLVLLVGDLPLDELKEMLLLPLWPMPEALRVENERLNIQYITHQRRQQ